MKGHQAEIEEVGRPRRACSSSFPKQNDSCSRDGPGVQAALIASRLSYPNREPMTGKDREASPSDKHVDDKTFTHRPADRPGEHCRGISAYELPCRATSGVTDRQCAKLYMTTLGK